MNYFIEQIKKIHLHYKFQDFCGLPYGGHPKGCPNFNINKQGCPYTTPLIDKYLDITKTMYLIGIDFDLQAHRNKMKRRHPSWSLRQLNNVLYWQSKHRKQLRILVKEFLKTHSGYCVITRPEAYGVGMQATLNINDINIKLDWHYPLKRVWRIALIGRKV